MKLLPRASHVRHCLHFYTMSEMIPYSYLSSSVVEDLNKKREPLPTMEAIYLVTPCDNSIRGIMNDFPSASRAKYKSCHVYFTEACAEELFNDLCKHPVSKFIKTLKEINIAFLPYESQVRCFHVILIGLL